MLMVRKFRMRKTVVMQVLEALVDVCVDDGVGNVQATENENHGDTDLLS